MKTLYRQFTQQTEIDAQYNAGASIPDFGALMAHCQVASARTRETLPCHLKAPYGPTLAETLDIFPAEQPGAPVVVFLHGGYWRRGAAADYSFVAEGPRARGLTTVVVDYALCPWVPLGEIVRQARASVAWVYRHIAEYGGDPQRILVAGHSAGGHLTAMSLLTPWKADYGLPDDLVKAAVPISGLFDLEPLRWSYLQPELQLTEATVRHQSPVHQLRPVAAEVLVAWGGLESAEFERQSCTFADLLQTQGARVQRQALPGAHHMSVLDGWRDPNSVLCHWMAQALA